MPPAAKPNHAVLIRVLAGLLTAAIIAGFASALSFHEWRGSVDQALGDIRKDIDQDRVSVEKRFDRILQALSRLEDKIDKIK